jgi:ergothioneine biosynthesis protein EgtB
MNTASTDPRAPLVSTPEAVCAPAGDAASPLRAARRLTDELFACVRPEALRARPVPERHRLIFYLGHLEAFDWNLLAPDAGLPAFLPEFDRLFAFGIDPRGGALPDEPAFAWPPEEQVQRYVSDVRERLGRLLGEAPADARRAQLVQAALEHRLMHAETLAWLISWLPAEDKRPPAHEPPPDGRAPEPAEARIPAGFVTLGRSRAREGFGWDNEYEVWRLAVPEFGIDVHDITNGQFLRFVQAGGYDDERHWTPAGWAWRQSSHRMHPAAWRAAGEGWMLRAMWSERPLPAAWPVYVNQHEAAAYARWIGRRLPTEPELQRAAYGAADVEYPWGDEPPDASRGNFDFRGWDPCAAGSHPHGASAFGVQDLLGNGWEWTSTTWGPLPGFRPFDFYPGYSRNFFDGEHVVLKGGSPRTAARLLRRSFRNWFRPGTSFAWATFRTAGR